MPKPSRSPHRLLPSGAAFISMAAPIRKQTTPTPAVTNDRFSEKKPWLTAPATKLMPAYFASVAKCPVWNFILPPVSGHSAESTEVSP